MTTLSIHHLRKRYGDRLALDDVTFEVSAGEIYGFVGSNGAGKTTTMRSVLGVITVDEGEVRVDGHPITAADRRAIGYMPEERGLYPKMPVGDQLVYLARLHGFGTAEAQAAADEWTDRLGIAERRDDTIDSLSLGNQQRVQLAAALVHAPALLVLDEPFSGLDPVAVEVMAGVLRELANQGRPVIFSSHQLELVERLSDRIGIIRAGRMVAEGTVDELRADAPVRYRIVAPGLASGWSAQLPQVIDESTDERGSTIELRADSVDAESAVLQAALRLAPVTEFTRIRPNLTELYREVVAA